MKKETRNALLVGAVVIFILFFLWRKLQGGNTYIESGDTNIDGGGNDNPLLWEHGIPPNYEIHFGGGNPFESTINVMIDAPAIMGLSDKFMPMFGFVGIVAR